MDVILGPPGCGKTHRLIEEVKKELESGTPPERIGFASFTKKAVDEALTRICTEFGLSKKRFPFVRTLHSMCFLALGLQRSDVMAPSDWKQFGEEMGFDMIGTSRSSMEDGLILPGSTREGDRYLSAIERASSIAVSEKSTPLTLAPSLAQLRESRPKWHCRWRRVLPRTSPRATSSMLWRLLLPEMNPSKSYSSELACMPTSSFQRFRLVL